MVKQFFITLCIVLVCGLLFAGGSKIYRFATDAETFAGIRADVGITPANLQAMSCCVHNSAAAYISTGGTMTINTGSTFEKLDEGNIVYTAGLLENFTHDDGRLTYTGTPTVHSLVVVNLSGESGEAAQVVQFRLAKNGTTIAGTNMTREFTAQNKDTCIGLNWLFELTTDDYIEVFGTSNTNGDTFDINNLTFTLINEN